MGGGRGDSGGKKLKEGMQEQPMLESPKVQVTELKSTANEESAVKLEYEIQSQSLEASDRKVNT